MTARLIRTSSWPVDPQWPNDESTIHRDGLAGATNFGALTAVRVCGRVHPHTGERSRTHDAIVVANAKVRNRRRRARLRAPAHPALEIRPSRQLVTVWTPATYRTLFAFHDFELAESSFELRRGGRPVRIQPKALKLLLHLVTHRHRAVTARELLASLWP